MGPPSYYTVFCQELPCGEEGVVSQRRQAHTEGKNVPKTKKEHLKPLSDGSADTITDTHTHTPPKAQAHNYLGAATQNTEPQCRSLWRLALKIATSFTTLM